ncbi:ATP-binding protein [Corallococcus exiguus]|uniref:ATP-binding protein n=1 Tax=Corallococcus exiguus TaxID=83462 RepID=UPI0015613094|nr:ATP-binding protein [Corallococcus exiguus]NRD48801.1 ATP-binding protein [Corallococcus exiguus]
MALNAEKSAPERIPPNPKLLIEALRSIGYSFEGAVADVIDNSIGAKARNVLVRFVHGEERIEKIIIADDGVGMSEAHLAESMRFGSGTEKTLESLSKFGLGMKLASLSQGTALTVLTRSGGEASGRRWTVAGIGEDWYCEILSVDEVTSLLKGPYAPVKLGEHGTVVVWSDLDKVKVRKGGVDHTIHYLVDKLELHLGLHFHRFIEDQRVRVWIDIQPLSGDMNGVRQEVEALNPFGYEPKQAKFGPRGVPLDLSPFGELVMDGHIWPVNSSSRTYRLDGAAGRQGFYFYRNDRLIQAGGWNDLRLDTEPHLSLARVRIELPSTLDAQFSLDVQKASIKAPPVFLATLKTAMANSKSTFAGYLRDAQQAYRKQEREKPENLPLVPGAGLGSQLRQVLKETMAPNERRVREVAFEWVDLESGEFFEIDRDELTIRMNRAFRARLLDGRKASSADLPIVKVLLFLLLEDVVDSGRLSGQQQAWIEKCNKSLRQAMKTLRSE